MVDLVWIENLESNLIIMEFFFLFFSFLIIFNSLQVILSENPVFSILFLILVFLNSAVLLLFFYIDFISIIILVVYVGAIAVLFLFVVMMMNIKMVLLQESMYRYLPIGLFICISFFIEIFFILDFSFFNGIDKNILGSSFVSTYTNWFSLFNNVSLISSISEGIFFYKWVYLIICAIILGLAMVGAINLTIVKEEQNLLKSQLIEKQVFSNYKNRINLFHIKNYY